MYTDGINAVLIFKLKFRCRNFPREASEVSWIILFLSSEKEIGHVLQTIIKWLSLFMFELQHVISGENEKKKKNCLGNRQQ